MAQMRIFIATNGKEVLTAGYAQCVSWARQLKSDLPTVIHTARGGDRRARVIAEVMANEDVRHIMNGRIISITKLYRYA